MKNKETHREPFFRMVKRDNITFRKSVLIRVVAIIAALLVDALFIFFVTGLNPLAVYKEMFLGSFGNSKRFMWAMRDMTTLLCIGVALAPAFKMKFWNIGAEGQILMGALSTAA